jgi:exodeoxyribonuclease-1
MSDSGTDLSFFWHDYETFGRVPRRDRPAQFAGLRTNAQLEEIDAPVMLHCRPAPDFLPDPEACLLTGITPQLCLARGVPEHAFAHAIEQQLARPGTVGVGYNSIRFDDEVTRHLFWRSLIDPYAREWRDGCGRWDLLDVVRCTRALRPEGIEWPVHEDGKPSLKLEHLTAANGLAHEAAHDALSDVRATLALARLVRAHQPRLWEFCLKLRHKAAVIDEIGSGRPFLHVSGMFAPERGGIAIVWPLGPHPTNKNEVIVWDLSADPEQLKGLSAEQVRERMFSRADALPEGVTRLPIKTIHINKAPVVVGNLNTLSAPLAERWGIDRALAERHAQAAARLTPQWRALWPKVFERPAPAQRLDVDEDLYGGFVGHSDRSRLQRLRGMTPDQLGAQRTSFDDARLDELVFRYRARNFAGTLSDDERQRWEQHRAARLIDGQGDTLTLQAFFDRIDALNESADERGQEILGALYDYAEQIAPEAD